MNADSVVLGVDGTAGEGKPTWLSENADGSGDYAKRRVYRNKQWLGIRMLVQPTLEVITQTHNQKLLSVTED